MAMSVHKSLFDKEAKGPEKGSVFRCQHCGQHSYFDGGEVTAGDGGNSAKEFGREHQGALDDGRETDKYDDSFDHYYEEGEAGFADGGEVRSLRKFQKGAESNSDSSFAGYLAKRRSVRSAYRKER